MLNQHFSKGVIFTCIASIFWGLPQPLFFNELNHVNTIEVVLHRGFWSFILLFLILILISNIRDFLSIFKSRKKIFILTITACLIATNWGGFIFAVGQERVQDASMGYFITPMISIVLGYFFLKEKITIKAKLSIFIVLISILYLLFIDFKSIPWIGLLVAILWSTYNLVRKKINVDTDVGLLIESLFILPFILVAFYIITKNNFNDFDITNPKLMFILMLAGPMTVIPLFLYVRGVELSGLGPAGMIFYITPTLQFLLGYYLFNEALNIEKLLSFILIWIAVFIYLKDLYENY